MEKIRSFDVFDTLFARRFINSDHILRAMEEREKIPSFFTERKSADTGGRSLKQIYQALADKNVIPQERVEELSALEVSLEKDTIFPIKENIDQVRNGDLLISDMYMSGPDILSMVRAVGMDKQVTIYQSNSGKSSGSLWSQLTDLNLEYHLGDNIKSDYENPKAVGLPAKHYTKSMLFTEVENFLFSKNLANLALMIREIRLRNFDEKYSDFLDISGQLNVPMLLVASEILNRKHQDAKFAFLGRDCQLWYSMYNSYYKEAHYVPFSRKVALNQPEVAAQYLKTQTPSDATLVDISSTGRTWEVMCKYHPFNIAVLLYSSEYFYSKNKPKLPDTFNAILTNTDVPTNLLMEIFNCGDHGHLSEIELKAGIPIVKYGEPELDSELINAIHKPIKDAIALSKYYLTAVRTELLNINDETLKELLALFARAICSQDKIKSQVGSFFQKEEKYLSEVSNG